MGPNYRHAKYYFYILDIPVSVFCCIHRPGCSNIIYLNHCLAQDISTVNKLNTINLKHLYSLRHV